MSKKDVSDKVSIYKLKTTEDIMKHYDKWADKYDKDMVEWNYTGPQETVDIFKKYTSSKVIKIFDAGCGTGRVGIELKKFGYTNIDGADLSKKLLNLIPKGFYNKLEQIDLNKALNKKSNIYDAVLCVGTFTFGHVKPPALDELIRIIKNNGLICFTINEGIYEKYGFDKKIKELSEKKAWNIKEFFKSNYIASKDVNAWLCLAKIVK